MPSKKRGGENVRKRQPRWDIEAQEFWAGKNLLCEFRRPVLVLGPVLTEFEQQGWPHSIKSPFAGKPNGKERTRHARKMLTRCQRAIEFHCTDGSTHLTWRWRPKSAPPVRPHPRTLTRPKRRLA